MVARGAVHSADHGLALGHFERVRGIGVGQRECARGHALTAGAMAGHRQQRLTARLEPHPAAPAAALPRALTHAATVSFTSATIFFAASPRSFAGMIGSPDDARMSLPCCTLVPSRRTTSGTFS